MKKTILVLLGTLLAFGIISCDNDDSVVVTPTPTRKPTPPKKEEKINIVSQFVYDGLSSYYKWADEMINKKPTSADTDPEKYFYSLRSKPDIDHHWSWITDDAKALVKGFSGVKTSFGYNLKFIQTRDRKIYAVVKYVYANTPASKAGIKRLDFIGEVNGKAITADSEGYISTESKDALYGSNATTFSLYQLDGNTITKKGDVTATPEEINTDPVLLDTIYTVGTKKIGYLFYTSFIADYNESLYNAFSKFKSEGVTDLVLDLRYNRGGGVTAATYLASMIAPRSAVENKSTLVEMDYNSYVNKLFDENGWSRTDNLGKYNSKKFSNPLYANLNLDKVYIIATKGSYSASELTIFCLDSYMDVVLIGNHTGGKYTASWTIVPYNDNYGITIYQKNNLSDADKSTLGNWAMQPIVAIYSNKDGDNFSATNGLDPDYNLEEGDVIDWTPLGDTNDVFLGQALYLITGDEAYNPSASKRVQTRATNQMPSTFIKHRLSDIEEIKKESVILDNMKFTPEQMQEILKLRDEK